MAHSTFYTILGVPPHATDAEIAAAARQYLATTDGDERTLIINAATTLLDRESRESYDRLNGIERVRRKEEILSDNAAELAKYAEAERIRRTQSAFAELQWTVNFLLVGILVGIWLMMMFQLTPSVELFFRRIFVGSTEWTTVAAWVALSIPSAILGYFILNIFSETVHVMLRYFIVCILLTLVILNIGGWIYSSGMGGWLQLLSGLGLFLGTAMFLRYWGIRQLNQSFEVRPQVSRRRDQH